MRRASKRSGAPSLGSLPGLPPRRPSQPPLLRRNRSLARTGSETPETETTASSRPSFSRRASTTACHPEVANWPACPQDTPYAEDPSQRVHLTERLRPPARAASRWASHEELRTTDGPWYAGNSKGKATIRLTSEQTLNGAFRMSSVRWFRFSFYPPNPGFNWPADD
jgi:hypothetical protein